MNDRRRLWLRVGLAFLALVQLMTGAWAVVAPANWYRTYPGFGRHWLTSQGPYNQHLVIDAGAGFLAVGIGLVVALAWLNRGAVITALAVSLAHDLPHFVYHLVHPDRALSGFDTFVSVWGIGFDCALAVLLLVAALRPGSAVPAPQARRHG